MTTQSSDFLATGPGAYGFDSSPLLQFGVRARGQFVGVLSNGPVGVLATGNIGVQSQGSVSGVVGTAGSVPIPKNFMGGVVGWSDAMDGLVGRSRAGNGVHGFSEEGAGVSAGSGKGDGVFSAATRFAVNGMGLTAGSIGVVGTGPNGGLGGLFENGVSISGGLSLGGGLTVFGGLNVVSGLKHAVVPFPDGSQRLLCCMESPEPWFEDFGSAKLRRGRATVQLNDFANVIITSDYRVFLSPEGDCNGLYVARKRGAAFEVRELGGGRSSVAFSYRIVGRRKDIKGKRFDKFEMPKLPTPPPKMDRSPPKMRAPSAAMRRLLARAEKETRALAQDGRKGGRKSVAKRRR